MTHQENIVCAAIRLGNLLVVGPHHLKALMTFLSKCGKPHEEKLVLMPSAEAGYLTTLGRLVALEEAYDLANAQGQIKEPFNHIETARSLYDQCPALLDLNWIVEAYAPVDPDTLLDLYEESKACTGIAKALIMSRMRILHHLWNQSDLFSIVDNVYES